MKKDKKTISFNQLKSLVRESISSSDGFCVWKELSDSASAMENETWDCDDFWKKVHEQNLEDALDDYFAECYPDGIELTNFNDILRFEGKEVLRSIGYDEDFGDDSDEVEVEP